MAKYFEWDSAAVERFVLMKALPLLERAEREGSELKEVTLRLPPAVIKFNPPSSIRGEVGSYYLSLKLKWYGFTTQCHWVVKYRVEKALIKNAFVKAFLKQEPPKEQQ